MSGPPTNGPGMTCVGPSYFRPIPVSGYALAPGSVPPDRYVPSSAGGESTGGFMQYLVAQAMDPHVPLGSGFPVEVVVVYQPLEQGDGQIWAVLEARSPNVDLPLGAGQTVHDGASISAGFNTNLEEPTLGYAACDQSVASSTFHSPGGAGKGIEMAVSFPASASCSGQLPGYVWATFAKTRTRRRTVSPKVDPLAQQTDDAD